ncbi:MAG TPA: DUF2071 domain-containing protein [Anaerolineae bacterium]
MDVPKQEFLTAEWRYLIMGNYEVDPDLLLPHEPRGAELDTWDGRTFVSIVGFLFLNTRVLRLAIPMHTNFEEVNLRFYLRRRGPEGWRRGVVFVKELVPRRAIATVARLAYNENYVALPMRHEITDTPTLNGHAREVGVEYGWHFQKRWHCLRASAQGEPQPIVRGSEEEFIAEHYWGYSVQRSGSALEYQVEHPPWRVWPVDKYTFECDVTALYGSRFAGYLCGWPSSVFLAEGSTVVVRHGTRI